MLVLLVMVMSLWYNSVGISKSNYTDKKYEVKGLGVLG